MPDQGLARFAAAFAAAFLAGGINSIAGGGTVISFPVLMALGLPPVVANATSTVGILPGSLGSIWGFREELRAVPAFYRWLLAPALLGGALGALLLRSTPAGVFERIVPWLILFATLLFTVQAPLRARFQKKAGTPRARGAGSTALALGLQCAVSVYGGYFGAGTGILMLSVFGLIGLTDMMEMTALGSLLSLAHNGIAALIFILVGLVSWNYVLTMAAGSVLGGYFAARFAQRLGKDAVRRFVILVGVGITAALFAHFFLARR